MIFGWRLTRESAKTESAKIAELHTLLTNEQKLRLLAEKNKARAEIKLKIELARKAERERLQQERDNNKSQALQHFIIAERYENIATQAIGLRKAQMNAIVINRLEKAKNLGFDVVKSISNTINALS